MNTNSVVFFSGKDKKEIPGQLIIVAWKLKTPGNMGQVIRLAHNVGALKVVFVDSGAPKRNSEIKKTAGFSFDQMPWETVHEGLFMQTIPEGFSIVALETADGAENIYSTPLPHKTALLVGNETMGLPSVIVKQCKLKIYIPMPGGCKSLNVSHALSVAAFEWLRQVAYQQS